MNRLVIAALCGVAALTIGNQVRANEAAEQKDIEVEETWAEADGSVQDAAYLNEKLEQEKLDARLNLAAADKAIQDANAVKVKAEGQIGRVETEIRSLQVQQKLAQDRQKQAQTKRTLAQRRLATMIQQMRLYRSQIKKTQSRTQLEERALKATKAKIVNLQKQQRPAPPLKSKKPVRTASNKAHMLADR